jgi:hypothetical protein
LQPVRSDSRASCWRSAGSRPALSSSGGRRSNRKLRAAASPARGSRGPRRAPAGRVAQHRRADQQVQAGAVGPPAAAFHLEGALALLPGGRGAEVGQGGQVGGDVGVGELVDGGGQQLGLGMAEQLAEGAVDAKEAAVKADERHPDGRLVEPEAEVHPPPSSTPRRQTVRDE